MMWLLKAFGFWFIMLFAAFINGAIRETLIVPKVGDQIGHVIGVIGLSSAVFVIAYFFVKTLETLPSSTLLLVGLFWLVLSLLFEFGFFHYVMHEPWSKLLADYNVLQGRFLIVVWLSTLLSPLAWGAFLHQA